MNSKIKELAEQSGLFPVPDETETDWEYRAENARYEKFAELIINESIEVMRQCDYKLNLRIIYHGEWIVEKLKEHFGIE